MKTYVLGDRASWLHPELEPEKLARALEMGAAPEISPVLT